MLNSDYTLVLSADIGKVHFFSGGGGYTDNFLAMAEAHGSTCGVSCGRLRSAVFRRTRKMGSPLGGAPIIVTPIKCRLASQNAQTTGGATELASVYNLCLSFMVDLTLHVSASRVCFMRMLREYVCQITV